jgi:hypothetical protein
MKKLIMIVSMAVILWAGLALAKETSIGFVKNVSGQAFIGRQQKLIPATVNEKLMLGDALITGADGSIGVILQDDGVLSLGPKSRINLTKFSFVPAKNKLSFIAKVKRGTIVYLTGLIAKLERKSVSFETPNAVCGVRGTQIAIKVDNRDEDDCNIYSEESN